MAAKKKTRSIGKRISIADHGDATTIVIDTTITDTQRMSLETWLGGWTGLGVLLMYGAATFEGDERLFYLGCLVFWTFFWVRIAKVVAWRRIGKEIIRIDKNRVIIKNAFGTRGRDQLYDLQKISDLTFYKREATSFMQQLDNSFWIIGGDTVYFSYNGKTQVLGKQLSSQDAKQLSQVLNKIIDGYKV
jgi:hypothetical protein